ncbi:MAG: hypothetical protein HFF11_05950 [Angelakisella sp.]|jgi:hypothetical protein|nr:hypothetical protein [Angelakisella sp.]
MKRWMGALMALLMLLGGCGTLWEQTTDYDALVKETLAREYTFTGKMTYDGTQAEAFFTKTGESDVTAEFSAPEALKGLTVIAAGEELRVQLRGMDVDLSPYALPTQSILTLLREVLTGEKSGKLTAQAEGDTVIASGSILLTTYEIVFDKETMVVREIRIPSLEGVIEVSDFTFAA